MPLPKLLKNLLSFKEPRLEPGFVLAWDEPEEVEWQENKEKDLYSERFLVAYYPQLMSVIVLRYKKVMLENEF